MSTSETADDQLLRLNQETRCAKLATELKDKMMPGEGFILFLADHGEGGTLSYASSLVRDDVRRALAEFLYKSGGLPEAVAEYIEEQINKKEA